MAQRLLKILVIDDDKEICNLIKESLQLTGKYKVLLANKGNIGTWLAACRWHKPDLVLLDIMMPGMDGFQILKRLRDDPKTTYIPVAMLTARVDVQAKIQAEGLYCDDYIPKPIELKALQERIEAILKKRGIISQP
ncbi:MAG: response regulator [Candidatus Omnitrophota bacterium]